MTDGRELGSGAAGPQASLFNGYVAAHALVALAETGLLDRIVDGSPVELSSAAEELGLQGRLLDQLCRTLAAVGVLVEGPPGSFRLAASAGSLVDGIGYFTWALRGYGRVLSGLGELVSGQQAYGAEIRRDEASVALGAAAVGRRFVRPHVERLLAGSGYSSIVDLGCGTASFLIGLCRIGPHARGLGIDVSADACRLARENVERAGLSDRVEIWLGDARELTALLANGSSAPREVDLVTATFMLHDLLSSWDDPVEALRDWRTSLPPTTRFVIADTMKSESPGELAAHQVLTLGFELVHAAMGQSLFKRRFYDEVFGAAGFRIEWCVPLAVPNSWVYSLRSERG